jgi:hypothetical protein
LVYALKVGGSSAVKSVNLTARGSLSIFPNKRTSPHQLANFEKPKPGGSLVTAPPMAPSLTA